MDSKPRPEVSEELEPETDEPTPYPRRMRGHRRPNVEDECAEEEYYPGEEAEDCDADYPGEEEEECAPRRRHFADAPIETDALDEDCYADYPGEEVEECAPRKRHFADAPRDEPKEYHNPYPKDFDEYNKKFVEQLK
jgi:hypothetical protein